MDNLGKHCDVVYKSKLRKWYTHAAVRTKPRRMLFEEEEKEGKTYFPIDLVPIAQHPKVIALGPSVIRSVIIQHLYTYLTFTEKLEHEVVNSVARQLAQGEIGIDIPEEMRFDAFKIYCDEAYHALFSADLKRQIAVTTGDNPNFEDKPIFLMKLRDIQKSLPEEMRQIAEVFFVIVSETLISKTLIKIPKDEQVISVVREVIQDHAEDEALHHTFFAFLLEILWPQLSQSQREVIGPLLPQFILNFMMPNFASMEQELRKWKLRPNEIKRVLNESYPPELMISISRETAKGILYYFKRNGIFEESKTVDAFIESGLLE